MNVSVVITTYNNPSALRRVLESLSGQKTFPQEVIVADDGSGPDTAELAERFARSAPFPLHHVWQEDQGFRAARIRNEGVKKSSGDYIVFLDGDCIPTKYFINDHLALAEKGFYVQGKRVEVEKEVSPYFDDSHANSPRTLILMALSRQIRNSHHALRVPFFPTLKNRGYKGVKSFSMGLFKNDILAVNGFNEDFVGWGKEDSEFAARLYNYGLKRKIHPFIAVCFHLWHPKNTRESLGRNQRLFFAARDGKDFRCRNGIEKS